MFPSKRKSLFCKLCNEKRITFEVWRFYIKKTLDNKKHILASKKGLCQNRLNITSTSDVEDFHIKLKNALMVSNNPLNKLSNHTFKVFRRNIRNEDYFISFYRNKIISLLYESKLTKIKFLFLSHMDFISFLTRLLTRVGGIF